jgi:class 3 adenylate cyclase
MDDPNRQQIQELRQAIEAQESLRAMLGDDIVNQTIDALREKLTWLTPNLDQERKLVTCLFCDVVGSAGLARDRDPEEVLAIIDGAL